MNDKLRALPAAGSDLEKVADQSTSGLEIVTDALRQLRSLPQPPGDEATLNATYTKVDVMVADYQPFIAALRAGDRAAAKSLQAKVKAEESAANDAFNAYGLLVCGA